MVRYDAAVIRKFADRLYSSARLILVLATLLGAGALGAVAWLVAKGNGSDPGLVTLAAGAVGGLIGGAIGMELGFMLRLRAQIALCQVQIEENTRSRAPQ